MTLTGFDFEDPDFLDCATLCATPQRSLLIGWGKRQSHGGKKETGSAPLFYHPDYFFKEANQSYTHSNWAFLPLDSLKLPSYSSIDEKLDWHTPSADVWHENVKEVQALIRSSPLQKAVPYLFSQTDHAMSHKRLYQSLRSALLCARRCPSLYLYGFWTKDEGMLGLTPEPLFITDESNRLHTAACAATIATADIETFLQSDKQCKEHELVVEDLHKKLSRLGAVLQQEKRLVQAGPLMHMYTPFELVLNREYAFEELAVCLHPTPALGAYPNPEGSRWLLDYQQRYPRKRYGAPFGYTHQRQQCCYVAIRNM